MLGTASFVVVATDNIDTGVALEFAFAAVVEEVPELGNPVEQCWAFGAELLGWLVVGAPSLISELRTACPWPLKVRFSRGGHALKNAPGHLCLCQ